MDKTIASRSVGDIMLSCPEPDGWTIDLEAAPGERDGIELLTLTMKAEDARKPPAVTVAFAVPLDGAVQRWHWGAEATSLPPDWACELESDIAHGVPICTFVRADDSNRLTVACSEIARVFRCYAGIREETACITFKLAFFSAREAPIREYRATVRIDSRAKHFADAVREASVWLDSLPGIAPVPPPAAAFEPLYSSWYAFHQNVFAGEIEAECAEAARDGMKVLIVDDGWQTDDNNRGYAFCGDWQVSERRFPDMRAHVARVHALGMKYMVWFAVPFVGWNSANHGRFEGKYLYDSGGLRTSILDPRYPEVRDFIAGTYVRAVRDWDIDGLKLDFIDSFRVYREDPAEKKGFAGCDHTSVPDAVQALLREIRARLDAVKPGLLIEFRQAYIGPAVRSLGNMLRASDCPASPCANRIRLVNLRLTSGETAVHSDMLEWHPLEAAESAARQVLACLFGVIQYSMRLGALPQAHREMVRHWIGFTKAHRGALLHGGFLPHGAAAGYTCLEGWDDRERIVAAYASDTVCTINDTNRTAYVVNATPRGSLPLRLAAAPASVEIFDTCGRALAVPPALPGPGLCELAIPSGGYAVLRW